METLFERRDRAEAKFDSILRDLYPKCDANEVLKGIFRGAFPEVANERWFWLAFMQRVISVDAERIPLEDHHIDLLMQLPGPINVYRNIVSVNETTGADYGTASAQANSITQQMYHRWMHGKTGRKVYEVSPALAEHLKFTEFRQVTTDALKLPYKSVYIHIPSNADITFNNTWAEQTEQGVPPVSPVEAVSIMELNEPTGRRWNFLVIGAPGLRVPGFGRDQAIFSFDVFLEPGKTIDEMLERKAQSLHTMPQYLQRMYDGETDITLAPFWRGFFKWAMSVLLYMTWPGADVKHGVENQREIDGLKRRASRAHGDERKRLKTELKHMPSRARIYLGSKLEALNVASRVKGLSRAEGNKLLVRCLVTGHWRHQPHGPGRSERKLIWIKPFWRGPTDAPVSNPERVILAPGEHP